MGVVSSVVSNLAVPVGSTTIKRQLVRQSNGVVAYHRDYLLKGKMGSVSHVVNVNRQTAPTVQGTSVPLWKLRLQNPNRG